MRQKRSKTYRKLMSLYSLSFGFRHPYQVLVDSLICKEATTSKIELDKQMAVVLRGPAKMMITQCCIHELYLQGKSAQPTVDMAKTYERRKCNHREPIPGDDCITDVVGESNKHRYVIATQSDPLRAKLRQIPAVPIVHINRSVMILEPPSDATLNAKKADEEKGMLPTEPEAAAIHAAHADHTDSQPPQKKRRGPNGPNPLSVKKKKVKENMRGSRSGLARAPSDNDTQVGQKRRREEGVVPREPVQEDGSKPQEGGHRRRRRRKNAGSEGAS